MSFFIISLSIIALIYGYCGWRVIVPLRLSAPVTIALWLGVAALALLPHTFIMLLRQSEAAEWVRTVLAWTAYLSLGFTTILFSVLLIRDLAWLAVDGIGRVSLLLGSFGRDTAAADAIELVISPDPERRRFLLNSLNLGTLALTGLATGVGVYEARRRPAVVEVTVPVRDLPPSLDGFRIAQICDLHVGPTIGRSHVEAVVDTVNRLDADLVAFVGDLADGTVESLRAHVAPLGQLRSTHGTYFVTGNHEYYSGVTQWMHEVDRLGMTTLLNEHRLIHHGEGRLLLAGVTDHSASEVVPGQPEHVSDPTAAVEGAPPADVRILLAHQPRSVFAARGLFDLQLSGHTHGGQFVPWKYLIPLQQPYLSGLHALDESSWIYVSRGTGYWGPPVRLGAPSEVTHITLRASDGSDLPTEVS